MWQKCVRCVVTSLPPSQFVVSIRGCISAPGIFFLTISHPCLVLPPAQQIIWSAFLPCLRIWPTMARVVVGSGGSDIFRVVDFSSFGLCKVPCKEGLRCSTVYLGCQ